jgi:hypothetical protein
MKGKTQLPQAIEQQAAFWLPVCPVHLIADRDTLVLAPTAGLGLALSEAEGLIASFNRHFAEEGYCLYAVSERDWFLGSQQQWKLNFPSLEQAESMNCRDAWQQGRDAAQWRKLLNEMQMLWFSDAVNVQREQQGYLPINGLWVMQQKRWWQKWFG